jgi:hypothetical protein
MFKIGLIILALVGLIGVGLSHNVLANLPPPYITGSESDSGSTGSVGSSDSNSGSSSASASENGNGGSWPSENDYGHLRHHYGESQQGGNELNGYAPSFFNPSHHHPERWVDPQWEWRHIWAHHHPHSYINEFPITRLLTNH